MICLDIEIFKICTKCGEEKPLHLFYKDKKGKHGRTAQCKECVNRKMAVLRATDEYKLRHKIYKEEYYSCPENLENLKKVGKEWRETNKESLKVKKKEYAEENKVAISTRKRERHLESPEIRRMEAREDYKKNPDRYKAHSRNRRAKIRGSEGKHTNNDILDLLVSQNHCCVYCDIDVSEKRHVDHIIPVSRGGSNRKENLQILCPSCNLRKHSKTHEEYIIYLEASKMLLREERP